MDEARRQPADAAAHEQEVDPLVAHLEGAHALVCVEDDGTMTCVGPYASALAALTAAALLEPGLGARGRPAAVHVVPFASAVPQRKAS